MAQALTRPVRLLDDESGLHLYPLLRFLLNKLGPEYLEWDSTALYMELSEKWGTPGPLTWERIQAGRIMSSHDGFWIHMEIFENCGLALAGEIPVFSHYQPLEAEPIACILDTAAQISDREFSDEVKGYILSCCLEDATWFLEDPLSLVQMDLDEYDRKRSISRPYDHVRSLLDKTDSPIKDPINRMQVQVNNVISVRDTLSGYRDKLSQQMREHT